MPSLADAFVAVRADTSKVQGDVKSGFDKVDGDKIGKDTGHRVGGGLLAGFKGAIAGGGALLAAAGLGNIIGDVFGEARDAQKVGKITANAIKVTGGAAKLTAKQVADLSESISNKTGIDDEAVQSGANLLLTFKNVRNELGKGNDVFSQATGYAQDLAAAGFGDADTAAKMLGKALNDPLKGMTALGKAGVTFSEDQKKQIAALTKSGDLLGAQKIILGEVGSQVGGAAEASADPMQKLGVIFKNLEEDVGTKLLPVIEKVATWLGDNLPGAVDKASAFFTDTLMPAFDKVRSVVGPIVENVGGFFRVLSGGADEVSGEDGFLGVMDSVGVALHHVGDFIVNEMIPRYQAIFDKIKGFVDVALPIVQQFADGMRAKLEPLMPQIEKIFKTIGDIIKAGLELSAALIEGATKLISYIWENWGEGIMNVAKVAFEATIGIIGPALEIIKGVIHTVTALIHGDWSAVWDGMKEIIDGVWHLIEGIVRGALGILKELLSAAWSAIKAVASTAWDQIKQAVSERIEGLLTFVRELPGRIVSALGNLGKLLWQKGWDVLQGFWDGLIAIWGKVTDWVGGIATWIAEHKGPLSLDRTLLRPAGEAIMSGFLKGMQSGASSAWDFVTSVGGKTAAALQAALGGSVGTITAGQISLPGGLLDTDTYARINAALGNLWSLTQGSWSTRVAASAGTHAGSGVADVNPLGDSWLGAQAKLRAQGLDAWFRDWAGNQHIHLVNPHVTGLSSQALAQTLSFLQGGSGLAFDQGGWLPTGTTMTTNTTGSPERILSPHDQIRLHPDDIAGIGRAAAQAVLAERAVTGLAMMAGG